MAAKSSMEKILKNYAFYVYFRNLQIFSNQLTSLMGTKYCLLTKNRNVTQMHSYMHVII